MIFKKIVTGIVTIAASVSLTACSSDVFSAPSGKLSDIFEGSGSFMEGGKGSLDANNADVEFAKKSLEFLTVKDYQDNGDYNRTAEFGNAWTDKNTAEGGGNGCNTRDDILKRDLTDVRYTDAKECVVATGTLEKDPYTGRPINFRRGKSTSSAVQIDHIVPLKNAWVMGANTWTQEERVRFANDPKNLLAVDGPSNNAKSDKAADEWLVPDNPDFRCNYVALQVEIKSDYQLAVSPTEKKAMQTVLNQCTA